MLRYNLRYQLFLMASDVLIVWLALAFSSFLRLRLNIGEEGTNEAFTTPLLLYPLAAGVWLYAFTKTGVYRGEKAPFAMTLRRLFGGEVLAGLIFLGVLYLVYRDYSRLQAAYFLASTFIGIVIHRGVLNLLLNTRWAKRLAGAINTPRRVLIVGEGEIAQRVGEAVAQAHENGLLLVGYVADGEPPPDDLLHTSTPDVRENALPVLGSFADLSQVVAAERVSEVIVALKWFDQAASERISRVMRSLEQQPVNIRISPDYSELAYFQAHPEDFNGVTLVSLRESVLTPAQRIIKRLGDIGFSLFALMLTWPLLLLIAVLVRSGSPGPAIFRQQRVGQHGRRFTMYKFRTMYVDADRRLSPERAGEFIKRKDDPRVTPIGYWLRRTSLDELPQFVNVLKGDMSVVGPRPEVTWLAEHYEWWQRKRFEVPQGITGWWQVNGRSDKPMRLNIEEDLYYVHHYSIWLDLHILLKTILAVFTGRGAY